jgi:hypothetical protein
LTLTFNYTRFTSVARLPAGAAAGDSRINIQANRLTLPRRFGYHR